MRFGNGVTPKYWAAIDEAIETILDKGNDGHKETARTLYASDISIDFVPLKEINCSGVTGLNNSRNTNKRIDREEMSVHDALGEVYIKLADWTFDVAGQRGCQGTIVHEGLHACDFARIISSYANANVDPLAVLDMSLYELEYRAAIKSAEYLVLIGEPDYIDEGKQLSLVDVGPDGKPFVDMGGILSRLQGSYNVNENDQGVMMSEMLGIRPKSEGFSISRMLGIN